MMWIYWLVPFRNGLNQKRLSESHWPALLVRNKISYKLDSIFFFLFTSHSHYNYVDIDRSTGIVIKGCTSFYRYIVLVLERRSRSRNRIVTK